MRLSFIFVIILTMANYQVCADEVIVKLAHLSKDKHTDAGLVVLQDTPYGLLISPNLKGFAPGVRAMHIHEYPNCSTKGGVPGALAGGHYDPENTGKHLGPYQEGHLGDLPPLYVNEHGIAGIPTLAPRLKIEDIRGRSFMVHESGDNFADTPHEHGGGGPRVACGVIPKKDAY